MKIITKRPKHGSRRTIAKFLFFPVEIDSEWRWLEKASISQIYLAGFGWVNDAWDISDPLTKT